MGSKIITVDFGGTKILSALLNEKNEIVHRVKVATDASKGSDFLVSTIAECVQKVLDEQNLTQIDIKALCIGVPGTVNPHTGYVESAPNIGMVNYNIIDTLKKYFEIPILIENDVNLAALGINQIEFENKLNNTLVVFVGTGIGAALILNGKIYRGSTFFAGEIGHILVANNGKMSSSSKSSTFEKIASRTAVVEKLVLEIKNGKKSILSDLVSQGIKIKSKSLANAVKEKDKLVIKELSKSCKVIGTVLGSLTTLLNVDTIVLGGGVVEALNDFMLPKINKAFFKAVLAGPGKSVKIVETKLGDDAALYGGIGLVEEFIKN